MSESVVDEETLPEFKPNTTNNVSVEKNLGKLLVGDKISIKDSTVTFQMFNRELLEQLQRLSSSDQIKSSKLQQSTPHSPTDEGEESSDIFLNAMKLLRVVKDSGMAEQMQMYDALTRMLNWGVDYYLEEVKATMKDMCDNVVGYSDLPEPTSPSCYEPTSVAGMKIEEAVMWNTSEMSRFGDVVARMAQDEDILIEVQLKFDQIDFAGRYLEEGTRHRLLASAASCFATLYLRVDASGRPALHRLQLEPDSRLTLMKLSDGVFEDFRQDELNRISPEVARIWRTTLTDFLERALSKCLVELNERRTSAVKQEKDDVTEPSINEREAWKNFAGVVKQHCYEKNAHHYLLPDKVLKESIDIFLKNVNDRIKYVQLNGFLRFDWSLLPVRIKFKSVLRHASLTLKGLFKLGELTVCGSPMTTIEDSGDIIIHVRLRVRVEVEANYNVKLDKSGPIENGALRATAPSHFLRLVLRTENPDKSLEASQLISSRDMVLNYEPRTAIEHNILAGSLRLFDPTMKRLLSQNLTKEVNENLHEAFVKELFMLYDNEVADPFWNVLKAQQYIMTH